MSLILPTRKDGSMLQYRVDIMAELKKAGFTTYKLRDSRLLGESTIQKLRKEKALSWNELETLCDLLQCQPGDLIESVEGEREIHNMYTTAAEIREEIRNETKCDQGFINHLRKWGIIDKLVRLRLSGDHDKVTDVWNEDVIQGYKDYCKAWGLDYEADNSKNKEYLKRA